MVGRIQHLVANHQDCLLRRCLPGHITAAAWILAPDRQRFLLTHHRKLNRWLQLGGHADGEAHVEQVALREAQEESGMQDFEIVSAGAGSALLPLDVDVHMIPARGDEPEHEHHDIRFLLIAGPDQELVVSDESHDLGWFEMRDMGNVIEEESLLRMGRKAAALINGR